MQLISINLSLPIETEFQGKTLRTGIFKTPVTGVQQVKKYNIAGDGQADLENHGGEHKAVYGYSRDHYAYWQETLNSTPFDYGKFGENLTIIDLDETKLCIGDELSIGSCILQITQPRVPCFKLGIAFANKHMPKLFVQQALTGIYFRVIREGQIQAGNACWVSQQGKHQLPVQTLFRAFYDKQFANPEETLSLALDIPELSSEWREKILGRVSTQQPST